MNTLITTKELRATMPTVVARVRRGARYTVVYRSRPAFHLIPVEAAPAPVDEVAADPLYRAAALGRSTDGRSASDHDQLLYAK